MRVFVAAACPDELLGPVAAAQRALAGIPGVAFLTPDELHLTIIPPWEERQPEAVLRDFPAIASGPVDVRFTAHGYGTDAATPRLAWTLGDRSAGLDRLWLQAWRALWSQDPSRPPFPHVTFARFPEGSALPPLPELDPVVGTIRALRLYESAGGRFRIIGERALG